jgi:hypothetical protein
MKSMMRNWTFATALGLCAWTLSLGIAKAGPPEAEACAARLSQTGQKMFHAVAGEVKPDSDIASLMRKQVRAMIMGGRISREDAEQSAPAVSKCLLLLK